MVLLVDACHEVTDVVALVGDVTEILVVMADVVKLEENVENQVPFVVVPPLALYAVAETLGAFEYSGNPQAFDVEHLPDVPFARE